mmetsp:Transcript_1931/g.2766  ORF Transcript_1931/g.2766 Transcript_1931/m.2766 type:complete len:509 (+) Transcript_1931:3115-4641(+)
MLHQDKLFYWKQEDSHKKMVKENALKQKALIKKEEKSDKEIAYLKKLQGAFAEIEPEFVIHTPSIAFYPLKDNTFFLLENEYEDSVLNSQKIVKIMVDFGTYEMSMAHREFVHNEYIINFNVDQGSMKLIIFSKVAKLDEQLSYKITIFDLLKKKINYESLIQDKELCGRLESGLYTLVDGHIYYNNNCIKIRYDLISQVNGLQFKENEIFDYYYNIFALNEGEKILTNCPLDSISYHKFVFIITNPVKLLPSRVVIVPYLHEKRIYLNRNKTNTEYFYTSIEQYSHSKQRSIVCVNLSESKYYIYSQRGLLRNRIDFSKEVKFSGSPIAVSENGRNFLLMQKNASTGNMPMLTIYHLTDYEFTFIKQIILQYDIQQYIDKLLTSKSAEKSFVRHQQGVKLNIMCGKNGINNWVHQPEKIDYEFTINNKMDVLIKMSRKGRKTKFAPCSNKKRAEPLECLDQIINENVLEGFTESQNKIKINMSKSPSPQKLGSLEAPSFTSLKSNKI